MGCLVSTPTDMDRQRRPPANIGEVSVFVPGLRIPKAVDFSLSLGDYLTKSLLERLSALRTRIVVMTGQEAPRIPKTRWKAATQHGGSTLGDLLQAREDYLPVLLGLVKDGNPLQHKVQFVRVNQEDEAEETIMYSAWYEVLSILHLVAVLSLSQANLMLLPRTSTDGSQPKVSEESWISSIDVFLKAAGYLDCAVQHVLPQLPNELRLLTFGLGLQLTVPRPHAVKRRLACEMVKYWQQARDNITNLPLANGWGKKHRLFLTWKYIEAKVFSCRLLLPSSSETFVTIPNAFAINLKSNYHRYLHWTLIGFPVT